MSNVIASDFFAYVILSPSIFVTLNGVKSLICLRVNSAKNLAQGKLRERGNLIN
jgi:hypothetical protein